MFFVIFTFLWFLHFSCSIWSGYRNNLKNSVGCRKSWNFRCIASESTLVRNYHDSVIVLAYLVSWLMKIIVFINADSRYILSAVE